MLKYVKAIKNYFDEYVTCSTTSEINNILDLFEQVHLASYLISAEVNEIYLICFGLCITKHCN